MVVHKILILVLLLHFRMKLGLDFLKLINSPF